MSNCIPKKLTNKISCGHGATRCVSFNKDGNYCITGGSDNRISLWNPFNGTNLKTYCGHAGEITEVVATVDNAHIASGSDDKMVMLWDVSTGVSINRWRRHLGRVNSIAINDESNVVLSGGIDKHVYAWDRRSKSINPIQSLNEAKDSVISVDSHKWFIITAALDETVRIYDLRKGQLCEDFIGKVPTSVKLATDCHLILLNCSDNTLRLFDYENGGLLQKFTGHKNDDYRIGCSFIKGNSHVISGSVGNSIHLWNLISAQCEKRLDVPLIKSNSRVSTNVVHSISAHPSKSDILLAAAGDFIFLYTSDE